MATVLPLRTRDNRVPIGAHPTGLLQLDLDRLLAGRLLIQGSSGAGKSRTLRRIIEEAFDFVTTIIVDPEGEFGNLAGHIGATTLRACELTADGLTAAAARARHHRLALHLDLTNLDPDQRIIKAAAFFAGLIGAPHRRLGAHRPRLHRRRPSARAAPCRLGTRCRDPPPRRRAPHRPVRARPQARHRADHRDAAAGEALLVGHVRASELPRRAQRLRS